MRYKSYRFINLNVRKIRKAAAFLPFVFFAALFLGAFLSILAVNPGLTACAAFYSGKGAFIGLKDKATSPDTMLKANISALYGVKNNVNASYKQSYTESFFETENKTENKEEEKNKESKPENAKPVLATSLSPVVTKNHLVFESVVAKNEGSKKISLDTIMETKFDLKLKKPSEGPQVLIVHTHATEAYCENNDYYISSESPRSADNNKNVVKVGEVLSKTLESYGVPALHDKTQHDNPAYSGSYTRSAATIEKYLKKYPTIRVVLDIHRDSIVQTDGTKIRAVAKVDGKKAAQVMVIVGAGNSVLTNSHWKDNLRFGVVLHNKLEKDNPGISRAMLIRDSNYNMSLCKGGLLLEVGTCGNMLEEAIFSAELIGRSLAGILKS